MPYLNKKNKNDFSRRPYNLDIEESLNSVQLTYIYRRRFPICIVPRSPQLKCAIGGNGQKSVTEIDIDLRRGSSSDTGSPNINKARPDKIPSNVQRAIV